MSLLPNFTIYQLSLVAWCNVKDKYNICVWIILLSNVIVILKCFLYIYLYIYNVTDRYAGKYISKIPISPILQNNYWKRIPDFATILSKMRIVSCF